MDNECIFCKIAEKKIPSYTVFEDDESIAFLDINPLFKGDCLIIPKKHYETIIDAPDKTVRNLFSGVKLVSEAVKNGLKSDGILIVVNNKVGQEIPHLHVHVTPRMKDKKIRGFLWPREKYDDEKEMQEYASRIKSAIYSLTPKK